MVRKYAVSGEHFCQKLTFCRSLFFLSELVEKSPLLSLLRKRFCFIIWISQKIDSNIIIFSFRKRIRKLQSMDADFQTAEAENEEGIRYFARKIKSSIREGVGGIYKNWLQKILILFYVILIMGSLGNAIEDKETISIVNIPKTRVRLLLPL